MLTKYIKVQNKKNEIKKQNKERKASTIKEKGVKSFLI